MGLVEGVHVMAFPPGGKGGGVGVRMQGRGRGGADDPAVLHQQYQLMQQQQQHQHQHQHQQIPQQFPRPMVMVPPQQSRGYGHPAWAQQPQPQQHQHQQQHLLQQKQFAHMLANQGGTRSPVTQHFSSHQRHQAATAQGMHQQQQQQQQQQQASLMVAMMNQQPQQAPALQHCMPQAVPLAPSHDADLAEMIASATSNFSGEALPLKPVPSSEGLRACPVEIEVIDSAELSAMPNPLKEVVKDLKKWGITVTDPLEKRKVACPLFEIELTNGLLDSGTKQHTHSICILYQNNRCKVDHNCNQIHVNRSYYTKQRRGAPCCAEHHDLFTASLLSRCLTLPRVLLILTHQGKRSAYHWPAEYISLSVGLANCPVRHIPGHGDFMVIDDKSVCQVWQGSRCTYGKECNYVHLCRAHYESLPRDPPHRGSSAGMSGGLLAKRVGGTPVAKPLPAYHAAAGTPGLTFLEGHSASSGNSSFASAHNTPTPTPSEATPPPPQPLVPPPPYPAMQYPAGAPALHFQQQQHMLQEQVAQQRARSTPQHVAATGIAIGRPTPLGGKGGSPANTPPDLHLGAKSIASLSDLPAGWAQPGGAWQQQHQQHPPPLQHAASVNPFGTLSGSREGSPSLDIGRLEDFAKIFRERAASPADKGAERPAGGSGAPAGDGASSSGTPLPLHHIAAFAAGGCGGGDGSARQTPVSLSGLSVGAGREGVGTPAGATAAAMVSAALASVGSTPATTPSKATPHSLIGSIAGLHGAAGDDISADPATPGAHTPVPHDAADAPHPTAQNERAPDSVSGMA